ncbi:microtubule-binding protein TANGLED1-like isoform X2 [Aristolochia californica]|uniref:microtubule-binding protein TANGLED1-like isoform X2 n=1 Tax=Aristolochia californica TaxID=171875 RepID=UPI0035D6E27A
MVARSPTSEKKMAAALNPLLLRETVKKVDKCMARLQELQFTVSGGTKTIPGVNLSPRSTRGFLKTSLRCKQESYRLRKAADQISPSRKWPENTIAEWRRMSLPAMLVDETVAEILQTSRFAKEIVDAVSKVNKSTSADPETPISDRRTSPLSKSTQSNLRAKRKTEKKSLRLDSGSPKLQRVRSRINFKTSPQRKEPEKEIIHVAANRVSPKNRPWAKKTVLFPNPLFLSSPSSKQPKFCKTRSPVIERPRQQTPHRFIIKSPPKIQAMVKNGLASNCLSPTKRLPKSSKLRHSFSPSRFVKRLASPVKNRMSPRRNRNSTESGGGLMRGLKERPPVGISSQEFGRKGM